MSFINEDKLTVSIKKKNLSSLIEYCIENKIDFTLMSKSTHSDDFEMEFMVKNTKKAIALGMCLKELKLELNGLNVTPVAAIKASKKPTVSKENDVAKPQRIVSEGDAIMAFNDALPFDLGASN
ncbi:MAG: hypothetical protein ABI315_03005 [Bacteroidia bacterium]